MNRPRRLGASLETAMRKSAGLPRMPGNEE